MRCEQIRRLFSDYLDRVLSPRETRRVEEHLSACQSCGRELEVWRSAGRALSATLDADAVSSLPMEEFLAACMDVDPAPVGWLASLVHWLAAPRRALASTVAGSLALTSVLTLLTWYGFGISQRQPGPQPSAYPGVYGMLSVARADVWKGEWQNGFQE